MGIVSLCGFMGSGKSSVGKRLAAILGCPFLDLDREIELRTGRKIPHIFREDGEAGFRRIELDCLKAVLSEHENDPQLVLSLGGGTLTQREARDLVRTRTSCVFLRTRPDTIRRRLAASHQERPLLDSATLEQLLQSRMQDYCETAVRMIDTDGLSPQRIALKLSKFL